jgi:hypothetical protein
MKTRFTLIAILLLVSLRLAGAEEIRIATYNIENWRLRFDTRQLTAWAKTQPESEELNQLIRSERNQDDEDNWEIAETIKAPAVNADILVFQEGCNQEDLEYFNKRWLGGMYKTVKVFKTNTNRDQHTGILLKEGFEILETREDYHLEKDTVAKDWLNAGDDGDEATIRENRLFARGPAFVKVKSPGGYVFWVGTNHQKSKSGNDVNVAAWRLRESKRTHEIIADLARDGTDVVFGGDMNDELGIQEFENEAGGDAIAALEGSGGETILATRPLAQKGEISFGGYMRDRFRSFIDHFVVSKSLADRIAGVSVYRNGLAPVASDHYPVVLVIKSK